MRNMRTRALVGIEASAVAVDAAEALQKASRKRDLFLGGLLEQKIALEMLVVIASCIGL